MKHYDNYISLGYFCSVATELERIGLRSTSSPFDWCITEFDGVISAIENNFDGFLDYELLSQSTSYKNHYFNSKYKVWFFHDFDQYHPLKKQLGPVSVKYKRRIDRFYKNISHPTLFIRYISDEILSQNGKPAELEYIEKNFDHIISVLKSFNEDNDIIFLANSEVVSDVVNIFPVEKDENDRVARKFLEKSRELLSLLTSAEYGPRHSNLKKYYEKQRREKTLLCKYRNQLIRLKTIFSSVYTHNKHGHFRSANRYFINREADLISCRMPACIYR